MSDKKQSEIAMSEDITCPRCDLRASELKDYYQQIAGKLFEDTLAVQCTVCQRIFLHRIDHDEKGNRMTVQTERYISARILLILFVIGFLLTSLPGLQNPAHA